MTIVYTKRKNDNSTIRKVWNEDKTKCYGLIGTVKDLLEKEILEYCAYNPETWCFITREGKIYFARDKEDLPIYIRQIAK